MQYRLRTLLIVVAILPPVLALIWFTAPESLLILGFGGAVAACTLYYLGQAIRRA